MTTVNSKSKNDFGGRRLEYPGNNAYWTSLDCLRDLFGPLYDVDSLDGKYVAEIGSGDGRIVNMLLDAGAKKVVAVEPSRSFPVLLNNIRGRSNRVIPVHAEGEVIREYVNLDLVCSIGVLHHLIDPGRIVAASLSALKPGGKLLIWVHGKEGNEMYAFIIEPLRALTSKLPKWGLRLSVGALVPLLVAYKNACRLFPLPMKTYMLNHIAKLDAEQLQRTIYDQLNPAYSRLYQREEALALLEQNGFINVECYHRHKYSWTVVGERPPKKQTGSHRSVSR